MEEAQRQQAARHMNLGLGTAGGGEEEEEGETGRKKGSSSSPLVNLYQSPQLRFSDHVERASVIGLSSRADHIAAIDIVTACASIPRALAAFERLTLAHDFPLFTKNESIQFLDKRGFATSELEKGIKLLIHHRNVMTRMLAKYPIAMLSEGFKKAWDLCVLRYLDLDDTSLELSDTKQKAEDNLRKARDLDNSKREKKKSKGRGLANQDANLFRALKEECCRIVLHCLLLDLSDYHYQIARELPRRRFLATGTKRDLKELDHRLRRSRIDRDDEDQNNRITRPRGGLDVRDLLRLNTHGENEDHLNGTSDKRSPFQAAEKLYAFAEAEPKSLQHKRLVEKTIGLYTSFKLLFPSALPCIDPFTGIAYNEGDELAGKQVARPGDRYAGCHFRAVVGPSGDLTGLDLSSSNRENSVIVLDPPIPLHTRCTVECWVLLPFPSSSSSSTKGREEEKKKNRGSSSSNSRVEYRALCGDSDGDIVCCLRQGPSRHKEARDRRREEERVYGDANKEGRKKKKKREREQLHFGFFLFKEDEGEGEEEEDEEESYYPRKDTQGSSHDGEEEEEKKKGKTRRSSHRSKGGDEDEEEEEDEDQEGEKDYGFFETKRVRLKKRERHALNAALISPGWHHYIMTRCESGMEYYWDGLSVGYISSLSLPFSGFLDVETIGNILDGGHTFGGFSHFKIFSCYMDESAVKERYTYLQETFINKTPLGQGIPLGREEGEEEEGTSTLFGRRAGKGGIGKFFPGIMDVDILGELIVIPASKKRRSGGMTWALCVCNPVPLQAIIYRPETHREHLQLVQKRMKSIRKGKKDGEEEEEDRLGLVRCNAHGVGGLVYKTGPMAGTCASTGGSTINRSCIVFDPSIDLNQEFLQQKGWTAFSWIYTPLPDTGNCHVLLAGEKNFHICVLTDQKSLGMSFAVDTEDADSPQGGGEEEEESEEETKSSVSSHGNSSIDSDGYRRDEYPSGLDLSDLSKGWHLLCVTGSEAGQSYFIDGEMRGHLPKTIFESIKYCGNFITGNKPWGIFSHVRIYGRPFTVEEIATDYQAYRVKFFDVSSTQAPPPAPSRQEEDEGNSPKEDEQSDSSLEEELEREREEEELLMDRSTWLPQEKQFYSGRLIFHLSSDSRAILIKPLPASDLHNIKVFGMDEFVPGVSGNNVAFNTLQALDQSSPRSATKKKKKKKHNEIGGGIRVKPSISLTGDETQRRKKKEVSWTILAWISLPIKKTGRMHALVGGKNGEAHIVVADDAETLGVCTSPSSQTARKLVRKTSSKKAYYSPFLQSTASLSKESSGWHCLGVTCESKFQFFYLDGKFKGAVPAVCTSSITCLGNARSLQGDFLVPFGCFNSIYIYDEAMPPSMIRDMYKEHTRLLKTKSFDPPLSSSDEDEDDDDESGEEEEEKETAERK
ncbi:concanavalin a-like lectin glucanase family protein [Cystoisospora suis]|uniref:Concanavalin a-like lectin glucanase family protein n=1 Tax=Cystoisospora suis TaxID=483139 RepID=A0A2C6LEZ2_9APIC|nr:concanavalin a-like lectin glucanase family protein [Cystoisospora suis]